MSDETLYARLIDGTDKTIYDEYGETTFGERDVTVKMKTGISVTIFTDRVVYICDDKFILFNNYLKIDDPYDIIKLLNEVNEYYFTGEGGLSVHLYERFTTP